MRPRAAATSTTNDADRGISRPVQLVVLRITCVLALLVLAATWIPVAEAVVSVTRASLNYGVDTLSSFLFSRRGSPG